MIVDTFLFAEAHEREVLLAKLHVESEIVDHWIAIENSFTTKGDAKALEMAAVVEDVRFKPFLDRLHILSLNEPFATSYKPDHRQRLQAVARRIMAPLHAESKRKLNAHRERPFFFAERNQRSAAASIVQELSNGQGWVLVSDVDEMIDGSDSMRRSAIHKALTSGADVLQFERRRFAYDFDNLTLGRVRTIPLLKISVLRAAEDLGLARTRQRAGIVATPQPVAFEYSYCSGRVALHRKLSTFAHISQSNDVVDRALSCNHELAIPIVRPPYSFWHETVSTADAGHPGYVLENLQRLKTGVVATDYPQQRRYHYEQWFG